MASAPPDSSHSSTDFPCPCGSGQAFTACCEPILSGQRLAATAEQLMRARFTAHARHDFEFLHRSYRPTATTPYVPEEGQPTVAWTKLVVHSHELTDNPDKAFVDFSAYGIEEGAEKVLHEKSEFLRINGAWLYNREMRLGPAPIRLATPKIGRNDPCPCGSGKKYKHCCLSRQ